MTCTCVILICWKHVHMRKNIPKSFLSLQECHCHWSRRFLTYNNFCKKSTENVFFPEILLGFLALELEYILTFPRTFNPFLALYAIGLEPSPTQIRDSFSYSNLTDQCLLNDITSQHKQNLSIISYELSYSVGG